MLCFILAGVCIIIFVILCFINKYCVYSSLVENTIAGFCAVLLIMTCVLVLRGLFAPSDIYGEKVYEESRVLVPLDINQKYYLSALERQEDVLYSYDKVQNDKGYTVYHIPENGRASRSKAVVEISEEEIEEPICEVYYQKCLSTRWTYAFLEGRYVYIFRVPPGTVFS